MTNKNRYKKNTTINFEIKAKTSIGIIFFNKQRNKHIPNKL